MSSHAFTKAQEIALAKHQAFVEKIKEFFPIGAKLRCVSCNGQPFVGSEGTVVSYGIERVYMTGPLPNSKNIVTYLEGKELKDIRPTSYGFELWIDGQPYFGYERID